VLCGRPGGADSGGRRARRVGPQRRAGADVGRAGRRRGDPRVPAARRPHRGRVPHHAARAALASVTSRATRRVGLAGAGARREPMGMVPPFARLTAMVLDCPDPHKLAAFYGELTGWQVEYDEPEWVTLNTGGGLRVCFQESVEHVPPVWPDPTG